MQLLKRLQNTRLANTGFLVLTLGLAGAIYASTSLAPTPHLQKNTVETFYDASGNLSYTSRGKPVAIGKVIPIEKSPLFSGAPTDITRQWVVETVEVDGKPAKQYSLLEVKYHYGAWSLLPAVLAILMSLLTREPIIGLLGGIIAGALMLGQYDITDKVLLPNLASDSAAAVLLLYLWLLGGLMGVWTRTGAAQAFAEYMARHYVRGPRTAKLVGWLLGIIFFQGGTISTVLVGTTVRPIADRQKISHEEMSYVVDSTASPIAILLPFNAWPIYVQAFIFVPGVAFLATEADRIRFFFQSIPFNFYALLAIIGTLLLCLDKTRLSGPVLRRALARSRRTGQLDAPNARPMSAVELQISNVPEGYLPRAKEFTLPIAVLLGIVISSFFILDVPKVNWAFAAAILLASTMALWRGMTLHQLMAGITTGLKGAVGASVVLMLAITIGFITREVGAGQFMIDLLGTRMPFWLLPVSLQLLTICIAFSTGSSWGTFALTFPLALPLVWAIIQTQGLANPEIYFLICFAAVLNGSVYGDQCSPISDTTILSSISTGADLIDHVKSQIFPATLAALGAAILWTASTLLFSAPT